MARVCGSPPPPAPTETHLKARLTGKAAGKTGAQRGAGSVALTLSNGEVCWRFARLTRIGRPSGALIRAGAAGRRGPVVLALGAAIARSVACPPARASSRLLRRSHGRITWSLPAPGIGGAPSEDSLAGIGPCRFRGSARMRPSSNRRSSTASSEDYAARRARCRRTRARLPQPLGSHQRRVRFRLSS